MAASGKRNAFWWQTLFKGQGLFHLLFWVMYAVFMILDTQGYSRKNGFLFSVPPLLIYFALMAILVYCNILVLIPLLIEKKKPWLYAIGMALLILFYTHFRSVNQQYWDAIVWPDDLMAVTSYYHWAFLYAIWFLIISSMLFFTQKWWVQQQQIKNTEINQLQIELKYLRSQVNPHFLFNGLNTIYGNIDIRDQKARNTLLLFSDLLRYSLYEADTDLISLEKETKHLENYIALQKERTEEVIDISLHIETDNPNLKIAPLLFLPFTENAFKYSPREPGKENFIRISLRQQGNEILFTCENSIVIHSNNEKGIGLSNVKRRLELLYKNQHVLSILQNENSYFVKLTLHV